MKQILAVLALLTMTTVACKKSDDNNTNNNNNNGGTTGTERVWTVGTGAGSEHKVNNYSQSGETYSAYDVDGNSINFSFSSYPPAAGTYKVIADDATLGEGQVKLYVGSFGTSANTYRATGNDGVSATISFVNSRIKIVLPETWAKKSAPSTDSVKITATLSPLQ